MPRVCVRSGLWRSQNEYLVLCALLSWRDSLHRMPALLSRFRSRPSSALQRSAADWVRCQRPGYRSTVQNISILCSMVYILMVEDNEYELKISDRLSYISPVLDSTRQRHLRPDGLFTRACTNLSVSRMSAILSLSAFQRKHFYPDLWLLGGGGSTTLSYPLRALSMFCLVPCYLVQARDFTKPRPRPRPRRLARCGDVDYEGGPKTEREKKETEP